MGDCASSARAGVALLLPIVAALALLRTVPRLPFGRKLVLETGLSAEAGTPPHQKRIGAGSETRSCRLDVAAGIAHFDHERGDIVTEGEYIEPGTPIEVLQVEGNCIVVRCIDQERKRSEL